MRTAPRSRPTCSCSTADGLQLRSYRGAPDADYDDPGQRAQWLRDALDAVLAGREPAQAETKPVGCSIKWKQ